jgi:hypothetical protein
VVEFASAKKFCAIARFHVSSQLPVCKCEAILDDSSRLCIGIVLVFVDEHGCAAISEAKEVSLVEFILYLMRVTISAAGCPRARGAVDTNSGFFFV